MIQYVRAVMFALLSIFLGACAQGSDLGRFGISPTLPPTIDSGGGGVAEEVVDPRCPVAGMTWVPLPDREVTLGSEGSCSQFPNILMAGSHDFEGEGFCMSTFPFPGKGASWAPPTEAPERERLSYDEVIELDERLRAQFGLRLVTAEEYLWAGAGPENRRFPYGEERIPGHCSEDADGVFNDGYHLPIGQEDCLSWAGVWGIGTRNTWAVLDEDTRAQVNGAFARANAPDGCYHPRPEELGPLPEDLTLVVMGAIGGTDDAPGNMSGDLYGYHAHAHESAATFYDAPPHEQGQWQDDLPWIGADQSLYDEERSRAWQEARARFLEERDFGALWR